MTIPSLTGLETALSGLEADQAAIDTTGQNITNASTPGYSREEVDLETNPSLVIPAESDTTGDGAQIGTGVDITQITRVRNQFLDVQYRAQNTLLGAATTNQTELTQAQAAFNEPSSSGISAQLQTFWSDWNAVANAPNSQAATTSLVDDATTLTQSFNRLSSQLTTVQNQASAQYASITGSGGAIASDAAQIAQLNSAISNAQAAGQSPNTLEDQRDSLLDDLSQYGQLSVTPQSNGMVNVSFGDAASPLISGATVTWPQTLTAATGGQLGALLTLASSGGPVGQALTSLNTVANDLATSVNGLSTTTPFFSGTTAANLAVAVTPSQVQTSSTSDPGSGDVALAIAGLQGGSADQAYASLVDQIGTAVANANTQQTNSQALVTAVGNQRQSVSGVSLDQEMTNLMSFQQGYDASARAMTTLDAMLQTLITNTGTAGL
jgi:flagellar hook-associated protein 1 FlgK